MTALETKLTQILERIYPDQDALALVRRMVASMGCDQDCTEPIPFSNHWDERDVLVITYGNSIVAEGEVPLRTLHQFCLHYLGDCISGVHILPFFPYSSDDGFAVIDYLQVNDGLGGWKDIEAIARDFDLMADLVINHVSSRSRWFENYKQGRHPGLDYFIEMDPETDLSAVVRPRPTPVLSEVETLRSKRHVWCTFSPDQVDLNFANPAVLLEIVNIVGRYMDAGVRIFRLDAVAFLWKEVGTSCLHHQNTHGIIQLLRILIEHRNNDAMVITETNVPNRENLTYFGNANEAHAIYNFSLPPLLLYTLISGDCRHLKTWLMSMPPAQQGTAYLNFIASHDGIGVRPAEGLLDQDELDAMLQTMRGFGGMVSMRTMPDGSQRPYEINIALYDALKGTISGGPDDFQMARFLCAHAIMLALEGIPAIYIHSLFGTENDLEHMQHTGRARSINRHVWSREALMRHLHDDSSHHAIVYRKLRRLIRIRRAQRAFHPNATQFTMHLGVELFGFWRQSIDRAQSVFCINNVTDQVQPLALSGINLIITDQWVDLISSERIEDPQSVIELQPYQSLWISNREYR